MQADERDYLEERQDQFEAAVREEHGLSRRQALKLAAAGAFSVGAGSLVPRSAKAQVAATTPSATTPAAVRPVPGVLKAQPADLLIPRGTNLETAWPSMKGKGYLTPTDRFFVRNHTVTPRIDPSTWSLKLFGDGLSGAPTINNPVSFTLADLQKLDPVTIEATMECAGNGRSFYGTQQGTPAPGSAWTLGAVGVARWKGVRLADVLERSGINSTGVVDLMPQGLDNEVFAGTVNQGHVRRPLPVGKALADTIIAFEMNGQALPADHGFPARLVVPGWIGIANTKWLGQIEVANRPLFSTWNTAQYRLIGGSYPPDNRAMQNNPLKSAFELPFGAILKPGKKHTVTGRSWSGTAKPRRVDISTDGGRSFQQAKFTSKNVPNAWVQWEHTFTPKLVGPQQLLARATDINGHVQPDSSPFNTNGYWFDAVVKHPVVVL